MRPGGLVSCNLGGSSREDSALVIKLLVLNFIPGDFNSFTTGINSRKLCPRNGDAVLADVILFVVDEDLGHFDGARGNLGFTSVLIRPRSSAVDVLGANLDNDKLLVIQLSLVLDDTVGELAERLVISILVVWISCAFIDGQP